MIYVLVPAFNERANMLPLFEDLEPRARETPMKVILIDDGSADNTGDAARSACREVSLQVLSHEANRGLGAAVATGLGAALTVAQGDDVIVTIEGDNTTDLDHLPAMLERIEGGVDVVIASFFAPGGRMIGVVKWRMAASRTLAWLFRTLGGLREFNQVTPLYRCYSAGILHRAAAIYGDQLITETGFGVNVELIIKLRDAGARIEEFPSTLDWTKRRGKSKLPLRVTLTTYVRLLAALALGRLKPPAAIVAQEDPT